MTLSQLFLRRFSVFAREASRERHAALFHPLGTVRHPGMSRLVGVDASSSRSRRTSRASAA